MDRPILYRLFFSCARYFEIQLFLNLASLPLLIAWGLPFSLMTPMSNLIFNPLLFILLFLSSLIFFSELFCFPNYLLILSMEKITALCNLAFSFGSSSWLLELPTIHWIILIAMPISALYILHSRYFNHSFKRIIGFSIALAFFTFILKYCACNAPSVESISCNDNELIVIRANEKTTIVDPGTLGKSASSRSWSEFTLIPHLIRMYGTSTIDHFIILQFNSYTLNAMSRLIECCMLKTLYLPYWHGTASTSILRSYGKLRAISAENRTKILRLANQRLSLRLGERAFVSIIPSAPISHQTISYPNYLVECAMPGIKKEIRSLKLSKTMQS
jgi:hypothetical protein